MLPPASLSNKLKTPGRRRCLLLLLLFIFQWCIHHDSRINLLVRIYAICPCLITVLKMYKLMLNKLDAACKAQWNTTERFQPSVWSFTSPTWSSLLKKVCFGCHKKQWQLNSWRWRHLLSFQYNKHSYQMACRRRTLRERKEIICGWSLGSGWSC